MTRENVDRLENHCVFLRFHKVSERKDDVRRKPKKLERSRVHFINAMQECARRMVTLYRMEKFFAIQYSNSSLFHFPLK